MHGGVITCCGFSNDGRYVVTGSDLDFMIKVWDVASGEMVHEIKGSSHRLLYHIMFRTRSDCFYRRCSLIVNDKLKPSLVQISKASQKLMLPIL